VDAAGDQFLATAGFAGNQDRLGVPRHAFDHGHEALHRATGDDEFRAMYLTLNRRACFQCIPPRLSAHTCSASTLRPRRIPSRANEKASIALREVTSNARFRR
jgi:hypothetical protein